MIASALAGCLGGDDEEPVVEDVMGCMDPGANNYDSAATADDGSCDYGRAHADTMADYAAGTIDVQQAMYELEVSRKCREQGQNNPCEVVLMSIGDASTIDPHDAYDSASGDVIEQVYDTLYRYAGDGTGNAIIEPRLATGYSMSEDGKTYTFTLRDDVYFSNGDLMEASDVVYSWCRVLGYGSPDSHVGWILEQSFDCNDADGNHDDMGGESFTVNSATSFSVTLFDQSSAFISTIAYTVGAVINAELCEANRVVELDSDGNVTSDDYCHEWMDEGPMGAGTNAYTVQSWVREDRLVLVPNWMYWEGGDFNVNRVTTSIVTEASTRLLAFTDGEVDFGGINIEHLPNFCYIDDNGNGMFDAGEDDALDDKPNVASKDGYICVYRETFTTTLSVFNLHPKSLDAGEDTSNTDANSSLVLNHDCDGDGTNDCNVMETGALRAAISYAFDYDTHRRDTYDNSLAPQYGPIPTGFLYADTQSETFTYDLTYAEQLLEDAGFIRQYECASLSQDGAPTVVAEADRTGDECRLPNVLRVMANEGNDYRIAMAGQLSEALGTIGVATAGDAKPWAEYLTMYYTRTWDIRFSGWAPDYLDPDNYWSPFAGGHSIGGDAYGSGYENADVNAALMIGRTSQDDDTRRAAYEDAFAAWILDPNMIIIGQYNGVGVKHDDICSPPYAAIGSAHWFDYDKLPMNNGVLEGSC
ncbi:MAG: ABC transporter substrate-binding protein [Candidatus Thalassarchaeaceae archaeon]|nr:ABC transporter substrate-binding protein [Candidatus Thalassarchaeaceae archaeon]HJN69895.1 ABC transporter substrate-binding protein [Candidatus Thalassarchaeaceae archaeon]